jgi:hypothetical protein
MIPMQQIPLRGSIRQIYQAYISIVDPGLYQDVKVEIAITNSSMSARSLISCSMLEAIVRCCINRIRLSRS